MLEFENDEGVLLCKGCGESYLAHFETLIRSRDSEDSCGTHVRARGTEVAIGRVSEARENFQGRRSDVAISLSCEHCPHVTILRICQHKGRTFLSVD